jgi:hypothetical protein
MQEISFSVSPSASVQVHTVGKAETPVIVIDEFGQDLTDLIANACDSAEYGPDATSMYPGLRARLPKSYTRTVLKQLYRLFFGVYSIPTNLGMKAVNASYSLITTPETGLKPGQCRPHIDSTRPHYLAILHYLNEGPFCDTGLFRHRETGLERITEDRLDEFNRSRKAYAAVHGQDERAYVKGSNDQYELYHRIEYRPNRLAVYPGSLLHSGLVDPAVDVNPDPRSGRLTANIFVDFFPVESGH